MADPQFGLFASVSQLTDEELEEDRERGIELRKAPKKITGFADETMLYEKAIAEANRLSPDFVIMCGDMVNDRDDPAQLAELMRITEMLDDHIPIYWVAGNHDMGDTPTAESIAQYRERFGKDNYSFERNECSFIVLNSCVCFDPSNVPDEWENLVDFLKTALKKAQDRKADQIIVFMHHPLFVRDPDEEGNPILVVPRERRRVILDLLKAHQVRYVFAGHWHRNNYAYDGDLQMITSGPVGYPMGDDPNPSGCRVAKVLEDRIEHQYYGFDDMPEAVDMSEN